MSDAMREFCVYQLCIVMHCGEIRVIVDLLQAAD